MVRVRDCESLNVVHQWQHEALGLYGTSIVVSPSAERLVSFDGWRSSLWNVSDGNKLADLSADGHRVKTALFAPDETFLVTSDEHNHVVWNAKSMREERRLPVRQQLSGPAAISPNNRTLAASEGKDVHLIDLKSGEHLWSLSGHSELINSVAFTEDGNRIVTTSDDQTCGVWDTATGKRIAFLAVLQTGGWVIVDDAGRFDGSDGGNVEGLHWVVGDETISLHQLKQRYHEPQLLAKALGFHDEPRREVAAFSTPKLFPHFDVESIDANDPSVKISLENRGGGIGQVVVKINGKEVTADARGENIKPTAATAEVVVDLWNDPRINPGEENLIEVVVFNQDGYLASRDRRITFRAAERADNPMPQLWGIVAGVSDYRGDTIDLRYAAKDAEDFATALQLSANRLFGGKKVHLTILSTNQRQADRQPTRSNILAALKLAQSSLPSDVLVVYLAGHGVNHGSQEGEFYYLTAEAETAELTDPMVRGATTISTKELAESIRQIPALKQVMVLDTCASGRMVETLTANRSVPSSQIRALERIKERTGMHVLAGCAADAVSYEASRYGQGLLTHALLLGMQGAALRDDEYVDISILFNFAADRVPDLARDVGGIQRPMIASPRGGGSFDMGRVTGEDRERIPLQSPLPLVLRANFQDEVEFADTLSLSKLLNDQLRAVSSRSGRSSLVFVDAVQLPNAYRILGRYEIDGDQVEVRVRVFQDTKRVDQYTVKGAIHKLEALAEEILRQAQQRFGRQN